MVCICESSKVYEVVSQVIEGQRVYRLIEINVTYYGVPSSAGAILVASYLWEHDPSFEACKIDTKYSSEEWTGAAAVWGDYEFSLKKTLVIDQSVKAIEVEAEDVVE